MNSDEREFQTVVLAAMLHDIGKFVQRSSSNPRAKAHGLFGREWAEAILKKQPKLAGLVDGDLWQELVQHHHEWKHAKADIHVEGITNRQWHGLGFIVSRSDNYSSMERSEEPGEGMDPREVCLAPVAITVKLDPEQPETDGFIYHGSKFSIERSFPGKDNVAAAKALYGDERLLALNRDFEAIPHDSFYNFTSVLDGVLYEHLWSVPSDTQHKPADVSLYDHLRLSAAIAAAMYRWHEVSDNWDFESIKDDKQELSKYLLIGGDLSGIQRYIMEAAGHRAKGAAKRLRARSFHLQALTIALTDRFTRELGLTSCNVLVSSGGNFAILAQNTEEVKKKIAAAQEVLDLYFAERTWMQTSLSLGWLELTANDFHLAEFPQRWDALQAELKTKKQKKFASVISTSSQMKIDFSYDVELDHPICINCNKFPVQQGRDVDEEESQCRSCRTDTEIGRKLVRARHIEVKPQRSDTGLLLPFGSTMGDFGARLDLKKDDSETPVPADVSRLAFYSDDIGIRPVDTGFRFLANTVPFYRDQQEVSLYDQVVGVTESVEYSDEDEERRVGDSKTFSDIADFRPHGGAPYLGVLKADVDNLGQIFRYGLSGDGSGKSSESISRFFALSRTLDAFFSGWIAEFLKREEDEIEGAQYRPCDIYTIFSGGDDLSLVGRWDDLLLFGVRLNEEFHRLTCWNKSFSLSAGLTVCPSRYPISEALRQAEESLRLAKDLGRDRLTALGATIPWALVSPLLRLARKLETAEENGRPVFTSALVHRLLGYHKQAMRFIETKDTPDEDPRHLIYRAHLKYDLTRNLLGGKRFDLSTEKGKLVAEVFDAFDHEGDHINYMKFPLTWAAYRNRGRRELKEVE